MSWLISSSVLKRMFFHGNERPFCPYYIYQDCILKVVEKEPSISMKYGSYFETQCLGSGAGGRITDDLPRKDLTLKQEQANKLAESKGNPKIYHGEPTINHIRIDSQVVEFKRLCSKYQIAVAPPYNTQVRIYKPFDENITLVGELDIFPTLIMGKESPRLAIIDLKLTSDLNSTFGEFAWGDFSSMDTIQGVMYHYLVRDIDYEFNAAMSGNTNLRDLITPATESIIARNELLFLFWTFDYKKPVEKLGNKFFPVNYNTNAESELKETIRKCASLLDYHEGDGWKLKPGKYCNGCPIKDCKHNEL